MIRSILKTFIPMLALVATFGCFNSEKDYELLVNKNKALAEDLEIVENENIILNRSLENIEAEKESLLRTLEAINSANRTTAMNAQNASAQATPAAIAPAGGGSTDIGDDYWVEAQAPVIRKPVETATSNEAVKIYVTQPNDVLSTIAAKHNTTTNRLLELNPQLRNRRNYMIWANDKIRVP